ncbi:MAG TPA: transposon-transfer assisting family protein [Candidatus Sellimonas avistercoris]|nr:transposon-transfer assisting family protein [Candidatus Sellimonas avistercoris]
MRVRFEEEEYFVMAMFEKDTRTGTMEEIRRVLPFISEDGEMLALVNSTLKKMEQLTDQEFSRLDLETYEQEPVEEVSWRSTSLPYTN